MDNSYRYFLRDQIEPKSDYIKSIADDLDTKVKAKLASLKTEYLNQYEASENKALFLKYEKEKTSGLIENSKKLLFGQKGQLKYVEGQLDLQDRIEKKEKLANHTIFKDEDGTLYYDLKEVRQDFMHLFCQNAERSLFPNIENIHLSDTFVKDVDIKVRIAINESEYFQKVVERLSYQLFIKWLEAEELAFEQESNTELQPSVQAKPRKQNEAKVITYDSMFRDPDKGKKLEKLLKSNGILDNNGIWQSRKTNIIGLTELLIEGDLLKCDVMRSVGRALCEKFGLGLKPFSDSMYTKNKGKKKIQDEFNRILAQL